MADLESAATEAQEKVKDLTAQIEKARERFDSVGERIEAVQAKVAEAWSSVTERVATFLEQVQGEQEKLSTESEEAAEALGTLGGVVEQAAAEARAESGETRERVAGFERDVEGREPVVSALADQVQASARSLSDQVDAVGAGAEDALESAKQFLEGVVAEDLQSLQEEIRSRGIALEASLEECAGQLQESYDDWVEGLTEVEQTVEEAFSECDENLTRNVENSFGVCSGEYVQALARVVERVGDVERLLEQLQAAAGQCDQDVADATAELTGEMQGTQQGAEAVRGKLEEIKALLASYAFVQ